MAAEYFESFEEDVKMESASINLKLYSTFLFVTRVYFEKLKQNLSDCKYFRISPSSGKFKTQVSL